MSDITTNLTDMSETVDQIYQDNKDIEDVRALIQESKEIEKLAPPMIAFRATGTMTTQAADPGKSSQVTFSVLFVIFLTFFVVEFRETVYNYGEAFQKGVFTAPYKGFYTFYGQMRSNVSLHDYISI